jgi:hypothetical protein
MSIERQMHGLLDAGRQMLAVAKAGEWNRANDIQADCHRRAEALFAEPLSATDAAAVADGINQLMNLHDQVMELCSNARENFMQDMDDLNQGRQAVAQYTANSG